MSIVCCQQCWQQTDWQWGKKKTQLSLMVFCWLLQTHMCCWRLWHLPVAKERIDFQLALLVYKCQHGTALPYLAHELSQPADFEARRRLRSASWLSLIVCRTRLSTIRSQQLEFGTVCCSMSRLHHHCLFSAATRRHVSLGATTLDCTYRSYCCAWEVTLSLWDTLIVVVVAFRMPSGHLLIVVTYLAYLSWSSTAAKHLCVTKPVLSHVS